MQKDEVNSTAVGLTRTEQQKTTAAWIATETIVEMIDSEVDVTTAWEVVVMIVDLNGVTTDVTDPLTGGDAMIEVVVVVDDLMIADPLVVVTEGTIAADLVVAAVAAAGEMEVVAAAVTDVMIVEDLVVAVEETGDLAMLQDLKDDLGKHNECEVIATTVVPHHVTPVTEDLTDHRETTDSTDQVATDAVVVVIVVVMVVTDLIHHEIFHHVKEGIETNNQVAERIPTTGPL